MYIYIYTHTYIYIYIYIHTHTYIYIYINHVTHPLKSADISIFSPEISNFFISRNTDTAYILMHNF